MSLIQKLFLCGTIALGGCASLDVPIPSRSEPKHLSTSSIDEIAFSQQEYSQNIEPTFSNKFTSEEIEEIRAVKYKIEGSINFGEYSVFQSTDRIIRFLSAGGNREFLENLFSIPQVGFDFPLFHTESDILQFVEAGGTLEYAESLGAMIFGSRESGEEFNSPYFNESEIVRLAQMDVPLEEIFMWARPLNKHGYPIFTGKDIIDVIELGISFDYAISIISMTDKNGNQLFSGRGLIDFVREDGDLVDLAYASSLLNEKGEFVFQMDSLAAFRSIMGSLTKIQDFLEITPKAPKYSSIGVEVISFIKRGGTVEYAQRLAEIKEEGDPIFSWEDINKFHQVGGTVEYAQRLAEITEEGGSIFDGREIVLIRESEVGGRLDLESVIKIANLRNKKGERLFTNGGGIWLYLLDNGTLEYAFSLRDVENSQGEPVFTGANICDLWDAKCSPQDAQKIALLNAQDGKPIFSGGDVAYLKKFGVSLEAITNFIDECERLGNPLYNGYKIFRLIQLGINPNDLSNFNDTEKPNALVVYPSHDHNGAFNNPNSLEFFRKIREQYDSYILIAEREIEVYRALDIVPNIELFHLAGHGSPQSITLGLFVPLLESESEEEKYEIDRTDKELTAHLRNLSPNAVILLYACQTAGGDRGHLAEFIMNSTGRKVYASTKVLELKDMHINSVYPMDVSVVINGENCTYAGDGTALYKELPVKLKLHGKDSARITWGK